MRLIDFGTAAFVNGAPGGGGPPAGGHAGGHSGGPPCGTLAYTAPEALAAFFWSPDAARLPPPPRAGMAADVCGLGVLEPVILSDSFRFLPIPSDSFVCVPTDSI